MYIDAKKVNLSDRKMKNREHNGRTVVQGSAHEDSGVAISGELGEHSFSGEGEEIVSLPEPRELKGIKQDANDLRFAYDKLEYDVS